MVKHCEKLEEEEGRVSLVATTTVIEYLEPIMSRDLICKFPDKSAFDFNNSQSSIWSPLVPRNHIPVDFDPIAPRKLSYEFGSGLGLDEKKNKRNSGPFSPGIRKKRSGDRELRVCFDISTKKKRKKMMKKVKISSGYSPNPCKNGCFGVTCKGWNNLLKAASKRFKRTTKKKDPTAHVKLSTYLT